MSEPVSRTRSSHKDQFFVAVDFLLGGVLGACLQGVAMLAVDVSWVWAVELGVVAAVVGVVTRRFIAASVGLLAGVCAAAAFIVIFLSNWSNFSDWSGW